MFAYVRSDRAGKNRWIVVLNIGEEAVDWAIPERVRIEGWVLGNYVKSEPEKVLEGELVLRPWEGVLGRCA